LRQRQPARQAGSKQAEGENRQCRAQKPPLARIGQSVEPLRSNAAKARLYHQKPIAPLVRQASIPGKLLPGDRAGTAALSRIHGFTMATLRPASSADELFTAFRPGWRCAKSDVSAQGGCGQFGAPIALKSANFQNLGSLRAFAQAD
jgi:hypothetical protein